MNFYLILLRSIHIFSGVFWVGAAALYLLFIAGAARTAGPAGGQFIGALMGRHRFPLAMTISSTLTIVSGFLLYWRDSGGLQPGWLATGVGLGFTVGAAAGLGAYLIGARVIGPTARKLGAMGAAVGPNGPTADQAATLGALGARLRLAERANFALLLVALLGMATARYWWF